MVEYSCRDEKSVSGGREKRFQSRRYNDGLEGCMDIMGCIEDEGLSVGGGHRDVV